MELDLQKRIMQFNQSQLREAVKISFSISQVCKLLDIIPAGGNYKTIKKYIQLWNIDIGRFTGSGWNKDLKFKPNPASPLSQILVVDSTYQSFKLKKRLFKEGLKLEKCEKCGRIEWEGSKIPLELHHINGVSNDNRFENLSVLCPNCHVLTVNYRGENIK
ncbi:MAG: HNH endonuclease [Richelia sp. RM2_1_2]|nr:HNH endonuclease [Richelia sp. RM2_1_2]